MRIGISGVSSTGKTTLAKAVSLRSGYPLISDVEHHERTFRRMEDLGLAPHTRFFPELTPEEHINFERIGWQVRLEMESVLPDFIADESPLDFLNYCYHVCAPHPGIIPPDEVAQMTASMKRQLKTYDIIWYLQYGRLAVEDDSRRFTNPTLLEGWDFTLQGMFVHICDDKRPMIAVMQNTNDLDTRVTAVCESIKVALLAEKARLAIN